MRSREVFYIARRCSSSGFADVVIGAGGVVGAGTGVVIDDAINVELFYFVFWFDKVFPESAA